MPKINIKLARFSFGTTSAIITNLALISGLDTISSAKTSIIGGILVIAIADNIADTLGIHIHEESEIANKREVFLTTIMNFFARFLVSLIFMIIILLFPLSTAFYLSIIYGLLLLSVISYLIARDKKTNKVEAVIQHLAIAVIVIIISKYLGKIIINRFSK